MTHTRTHGFTLVELMVVIVIISVFAGMVGMSVASAQKRRLFEHHDKLVDVLKLARLESVDQGQVLGLSVVDESALKPASYQVLKLNFTKTQTAQKQDPPKGAGNLSKKPESNWQPLEQLRAATLVEGMRLQVESLESLPITNKRFKDSLTAQHAQPKLLWFGNGEATPVKIDLWMQDERIGKSIYVDTLGNVNTEPLSARVN